MGDSEEKGPLFKEGDKVTVAERKGGASYYKFYFSDSMAVMRSDQLTIQRIRKSDADDKPIPDDGYLYKVMENDYNWASSMFEESYTLKHNSGIAPFVRRKERPKLDFDL